MKVCLDSRLIKKGEYFVPIKGENFDGHKFIPQVLEKGAAGVIEEEELYKLAKEKLTKINPIVIAITGSVGKTSTREYITKLLSLEFKVCVGNLNTKLGLATNIINDMANDCDFFVAECGMDRAGELKQTALLIKPKIVVLTNVSPSHLEKLGTIENVIKAKAELVEALPENGVLFFNVNNEGCRRIAKEFGPVEQYPYGFVADIEKLISVSPLIGEHLNSNLDGAILVADYFLKKHRATANLDKIKTYKGRMNKISGIKGSIIFDDTYNASPESAKYALESINWYSKNILKGARIIAVLGGMLELGDFENTAHTIVGDSVAKNNIDVLVLVGELALKIKNSTLLKKSKIVIFEAKDYLEASSYLLKSLRIGKNDIILVKGSQGIRLEKVVKEIMQNPEKARDLLVRQDVRWS